MKKTSLHQKVLISLLLAFAIGLFANYHRDSTQTVEWVAWLVQSCEFVGKLF